AKELRPYNVAIIGLMPGFVATERMAAELAEFGFDASKGLPTDNPARVCAMLATADDPMFFSGRDVHGPTFHAEHALLRVSHRAGLNAPPRRPKSSSGPSVRRQ